MKNKIKNSPIKKDVFLAVLKKNDNFAVDLTVKIYMKISKSIPKKEELDSLTYRQAYERLETIVETIENEVLDIDILSKQVEEAIWLIEFCKRKIKTTDKTLEKIFEQNNQLSN